MAAPNRRSPASVIDRLFRDPRRFEVFQAVRVLEWQARRDARDPRLAAGKPVGHDHVPKEEVARLSAEIGLTFPGNELVAAERGQGGRPPTLRTPVMGLVGALGVLPQHYTEMVIKTVRARSRSLRDFLDLFHHRAISLFYRAWAKHRLPIAWERTAGSQGAGGRGAAPDPVTTAIASFVGFGTRGMEDRLSFPDDTVLHYAGLLAHTPRSVIGLRAMLSDFLGRPVTVDSFVGSWLTIAPDGQTRLPTALEPEGRHCRLGVDTVAGERAWDVQGKFRIRIGPLDYDRFLVFMPEGREMIRLRDLVRLYVGPELDFEVEVTVQGPYVPQTRLAGPDAEPGEAARLGWNTWMLHGPSPVDRADAVFQVRDL